MSESVSARKAAEAVTDWFKQLQSCTYPEMVDAVERIISAACSTVAPGFHCSKCQRPVSQRFDFGLWHHDDSKESSLMCEDATAITGAAPAVSTPPLRRPYTDGLYKRLANDDYALEYLNAAKADGSLALAIMDVITARATVSTPRCPKCGGSDLTVFAASDIVIACSAGDSPETECSFSVNLPRGKKLSDNQFEETRTLADFAQFFQPAPAQPQLAKLLEVCRAIATAPHLKVWPTVQTLGVILESWPVASPQGESSK